MLSYDLLSQIDFGRAQGTGSRVCPPAPLGLKAMRTVAAVVALVACVHAGLWALTQKR